MLSAKEGGGFSIRLPLQVQFWMSLSTQGHKSRSQRLLKARHMPFNTGSCLRIAYNLLRLSFSAFAITDTELKLIAALAMMGLSNTPKNGYNAPAATGTPSAL